MEITEIMGRLPHRFPFLMVDRIIEENGLYKGIKNVTINEWFFQGHFPGQPIMPGVLILEAMAQVAGLTAFRDQEAESERQSVLLLAIDKVRFKKTVVPGDSLIIVPNIVWIRDQNASVHVKAMVGDQVAAEAQFLLQNGIGG